MKTTRKQLIYTVILLTLSALMLMPTNAYAKKKKKKSKKTKAPLELEVRNADFVAPNTVIVHPGQLIRVLAKQNGEYVKARIKKKKIKDPCRILPKKGYISCGPTAKGKVVKIIVYYKGQKTKLKILTDENAPFPQAENLYCNAYREIEQIQILAMYDEVVREAKKNNQIVPNYHDYYKNLSDM